MQLKYIVIDVDGTLTDGGIYYDDKGNELKKFNVKDAAGFFAAQKAGIEIMVLTGRECKATEHRMNDLKVRHLFQNISDKKLFLQDFMRKNEITSNEIAYIGDDLNDLDAMALCDFVGCPSDACTEVKDIADYISAQNGGNGAVRDIIEKLLQRSKK